MFSVSLWSSVVREACGQVLNEGQDGGQGGQGRAGPVVFAPVGVVVGPVAGPEHVGMHAAAGGAGELVSAPVSDVDAVPGVGVESVCDQAEQFGIGLVPALFAGQHPCVDQFGHGQV